MKASVWRFSPFLLFIVLALLFWRGLSLNPQELPSVQMGKSLPPFKLPTFEEGEYLTPNQLKGRISLLNVWASWCPACTDEQFFLMQLAHEGVPIYGLNYKDTAKEAQNWLLEWGNPYQVIGQDTTGKAAIDLGVYGAPETFLIDEQGIIQYRYAGVLNETIWRENFVPRIKSLQQG